MAAIEAQTGYSRTRREASVAKADARVLRAVALRGKPYIRWPEDREWLEALPGIGEPRSRLKGMVERGSLASLGVRRWLVIPSGASTFAQAASRDVLLAAYLDGRADWYVGFWTALVDHGLTDDQPRATYVGLKGVQLPKNVRVGPLLIHSTRLAPDADWAGVARIRAQGKVFAFRSDLERTLLDTLERPQLCGPPSVWVRAWERAGRESRVDWDVLEEYSEARSQSVQARCAFWLRELGHPRAARRIMKSLGGPLGGARPLDASASFGESGTRDRDTGLRLNIPQETIDSWLTYGK